MPWVDSRILERPHLMMNELLFNVVPTEKIEQQWSLISFQFHLPHSDFQDTVSDFPA